MIEQPEQLELRIPDHEEKIRALGYAFGLTAGIFSPAYYGQMPPVSPVYLKGPSPTTNDPEAFQRLFLAGHELGFDFGKKAAYELEAVLRAMPADCKWPVCLLFADQRILGEDYVPEEVLNRLDRHIRVGLEAFHCIYQNHLL